VRQLTADTLMRLGYRVLQADSAREALRQLERNAEVELLFTDIVMPDKNGRELADEARRLRPGLRVLFTTGYTRNAIVHNGILDAGVNLIVKPYSIDQLARKLREVLDSRQPAQ
jgi:CheY-like chemotaxis protein